MHGRLYQQAEAACRRRIIPEAHVANFEVSKGFREKGERLMGGLGSGRRSGSGRNKVEDYRSLNVNQLNKAGYIGTFVTGGWQWLRDGRQDAWIRMRSNGDRLTLTYRFRRPGEDWIDVVEPIEIARVACAFGGRRPYFICPGIRNGVACRRRVVKLYGQDRYFLCRRCYRLAYGSQFEAAPDRAMRRANTLRRAIGGDAGIERPLPRRPKGMWRRTYERRIEKISAADERAEDAYYELERRFLVGLEAREIGNRRTE